MSEQLGTSPVGIMERLPNMKKRERSIYYREINGVWMQTGLLPSDMQGRETYLSKGFRLSPPDNVEFTPVESDKEKDQLLAKLAEIEAKNADLEAKLAELWNDRPKMGRPKKG